MSSRNTSADILAAANDRELMDRFVALAAESGVPAPDGWVQENRYALAAATVNAEGETIANAYGYAQMVFAQQAPPRPGVNPAAVTDDMVRAAIAAKHDRQGA